MTSAPKPLRSALASSSRSAGGQRRLRPGVTVEWECPSDTSSEPSPLPGPARGHSSANREPVTLHIYDVGDDLTVKWANELFRPVGSGLFHAGVEVFGEEWSFGCRTDEGTGVFSCLPTENPAHRYREPWGMGTTALTREQVDKVIKQFMEDWQGVDYNLLSRNCTHFCDALCQALGVGSIPGWVSNLAGTGASLVDGVRSMVEKGREMNESLRFWGSSSSTASPGARDVASLRTIKTVDTIDEEEKTTSCDLLGRRPSQELGGLAQSMFTAVSQLLEARRPRALADLALAVTLECVAAVGDLEALRPEQRRLTRCLAVREPWAVGPRQQPGAFRGFMPGFARLPWDRLFEIAWEPPCLFLRKPAADAPILVNGALVKQATFVLLHNVEISVLDPSAPAGSGPPLVTFRCRRDTAPAAAAPPAPASAAAEASSAEPGTSGHAFGPSSLTRATSRPSPRSGPPGEASRLRPAQVAC